MNHEIITPTFLTLVISGVASFCFFLIKYLFSQITAEIASLRNDIAKMNVTLAVNSTAITYLSDELRKKQ